MTQQTDLTTDISLLEVTTVPTLYSYLYDVNAVNNPSFMDLYPTLQDFIDTRLLSYISQDPFAPFVYTTVREPVATVNPGDCIELENATGLNILTLLEDVGGLADMKE